MSENQNESSRQTSGKGRGTLIALAVGAAVLTAGAFGVQAVAQSDLYQHMRVGAGFQGGWHGHERKPLAEMSDQEIQDRVERMVRHLSIEIDATPEQEAKIIAVATDVAKELRPLRERMQATGTELRNLLTAETIDRTKLEELRVARLADAEEISKTLVGAVADMAEVLTPEQRATVQSMVSQMRARRDDHFGGDRYGDDHFGHGHHGGRGMDHDWGRPRF